MNLASRPVLRSGDEYIPARRVGPDRSCNTLGVLFPQIGKVDRDLASNLIVGGRGDTYAARFGDTLKAGCDIDAVAEDIMRFDDDVTDVNADTKNQAPVLSIIDRKFANIILEVDGRANRLDGARKLRQEPVPGVLDNAAAVLCDCWLNDVPQQRAQTRMCGLFVSMH